VQISGCGSARPSRHIPGRESANVEIEGAGTSPRRPGGDTACSASARRRAFPVGSPVGATYADYRQRIHLALAQLAPMNDRPCLVKLAAIRSA
jgi:hypothetical protein